MTLIAGCFKNEYIVARATHKCDNGYKMKNRKFQSTISRKPLNVSRRSSDGMKIERTTEKKSDDTRDTCGPRATCVRKICMATATAVSTINVSDDSFIFKHLLYTQPGGTRSSKSFKIITT